MWSKCSIRSPHRWENKRSDVKSNPSGLDLAALAVGIATTIGIVAVGTILARAAPGGKARQPIWWPRVPTVDQGLGVVRLVAQEGPQA